MQLLEETEKAVGDAQLPIQHRKLIEISKKVKRMEQVSSNWSFIRKAFKKKNLILSF